MIVNRERGLPRAEQLAQADAFLAKVGLRGFERHYPKQLSGGMQQRTAIARALANDPRMLLMDEPFGALDHQTRELMQELLLGIWEEQRKTVLFVTHDIDEAVFMGSRVAVMSARPGRIKLDRVVPLARPRHYSVRTTPVFTELKAELTEAVRAEVLAAQAANALKTAAPAAGWTRGAACCSMGSPTLSTPAGALHGTRQHLPQLSPLHRRGLPLLPLGVRRRIQRPDPSFCRRTGGTGSAAAGRS